MQEWSTDIMRGCRLIPLTLRGDERGSLVPIEAERDIPFKIARVYTVFETLPGVERGFHAHHQLWQLAVPVAGSCTMVLDDGRERKSVRLDRPDVGLTIAPLVWHEMTDFSSDCVLMVLADAPYDEADYIRSYDDFRALMSAAS